MLRKKIYKLLEIEKLSTFEILRKKLKKAKHEDK